MGYSKCWSPGCKSRPGQGILFKYYPKDVALAEKWQCHIPGKNLSPRVTAVCEKHFEQSMFEKIREDGRKRLKENAVPTIPTIQHKVLGNITNLPSSPHTQHVKHVGLDASVSMKRKVLGDIINMTASPHAGGNTPEETGLEFFQQLDHGNHTVSPSSPFAPASPGQTRGFESLSLEQMKAANHQQDILISKLTAERDELARMLQELRNEKDRLTHSFNNDLAKEKEQSAKLLESLKTDIGKQQEDSEKIIEKLMKSASCSRSAYHSIRKRYLSQQKVKARLQQRVEQKVQIPWLHKNQQALLTRKNARGFKWHPAMIRKGLVLKMKAGTRGYTAFVQEIPLLPSARTLQEAVQFIKFDSGLLNEVFDLLEELMKEFPDVLRDCILVVDEMAITEGVRYCNSLKKFVGECTFPTHSGRANKAMLVLLAGLCKRWKVTVAIYFTNKKDGEVKMNETGEAFKTIITQVITRAASAGAKVCAVGSDMGPDNLAMWKAFGVSGSRDTPVTASFSIPTLPGTVVHILPDFIHLFKSIKSMMENNKIIKLPQDIVEEEGLQSAVIDFQHIADLMEYEDGFELKVAFRLKPWNVHCKKHFSKMKVGTSRAVICHRTSVGLDLLSEEKSDVSYKTTAWFIELLNTFFDLVSSRHKSLAFSLQNKAVYDKAIALVNKVSHIFQNMTVGDGGQWKPSQRGMKVLCHSLLNLVAYLLTERGYRYVLPGRFTSDCIENLISLLRLAQAVPHAVAVLQNLKVITLCQLSESVKGSSYDFEETDSLTTVDMLEVARAKAVERAHTKVLESHEELLANPVPHLTEADLRSIPLWERNVIYDMAGSVIHNLQSSNTRFCDSCISATKHKDADPHIYSTVTRMKEYTLLRLDNLDTRLLQVYVTDEVFRAVLTAEKTLRMFQLKVTKLKATNVIDYFVDNTMYVWAGTAIPDCHNLCRRILRAYVTSRLKECSRKEAEELKQAKARSGAVEQLNSKSTVMRECASKIGN